MIKKLSLRTRRRFFSSSVTHRGYCLTECQRRMEQVDLRNCSDILLASPAATGKTRAYLRPILQSNSGVAFIVVPVRELVMQISHSIMSFGHDQQQQQQLPRVVSLYSGCSYNWCDDNDQQSSLVVVSTPLKCVQYMKHRLKQAAAPMSCLVLDEVDRLLDSGFYTNVNDIVSLYHKLSTPSTASPIFMATATVTPLVQAMAHRILKPQFQYINANSSSSTTKTEMDTITSHTHYYECKSFFKDLCTLILTNVDIHGAAVDILVIFPTVSICEYFSNLLRNYFNDKNQFQVDCLHGKIPIESRQRIFNEYVLLDNNERVSSMRVLCATDIAARGLDFKRVTVLIQFGQYSAYENEDNQTAQQLHRLGRIARPFRIAQATSQQQHDLKKESYKYIVMLSKELDNTGGVPPPPLSSAAAMSSRPFIESNEKYKCWKSLYNYFNKSSDNKLNHAAAIKALCLDICNEESS